MTVYTVYHYNYEESEIIGVFKHQGDAEECVKQMPYPNNVNCRIQEWTVQ